MKSKIFKFSNMAGRVWCGVMHDQTTWPIHGRYRCRTCWREYGVAWPTHNERSGRRAAAQGIIQPSNGAAAPADSTPDATEPSRRNYSRMPSLEARIPV